MILSQLNRLRQDQYNEWYNTFSDSQKVFINALNLDQSNAFQDVAGNSLLLWYKNQASSLISSTGTTPVNGSAVRQILDTSGRNNHTAVQNTSTLRPTYTTSGIGGVGALVNDGNDSFTLNANIRALATGNYTIFAVSKRNVNTNVDAIFTLINASGGAGSTLVAYNPGSNSVGYRHGGGNIAVGITGTNPTIIRAVRNASVISLYANGVIGYNGTAIDFTASSALYMASYWNFIGQHSEFIIINKVLDNASASIIESYLSTKYGISI